MEQEKFITPLGEYEDRELEFGCIVVEAEYINSDN